MTVVIDEVITAEESVVGSVMIDPSCAQIVFTELTEDDFVDGRTKKIFKAEKQLFDAGSVIDLVTVCNALEAIGQIDEVGGYGAVSEIVTSVISTANIRGYIEVLQHTWASRQLIQGLSKAITLTESGSNGLLEAQRIIDLITQRSASEAVRIGERAIDALTAMGENSAKGTNTGYSRLDYLTGGFGAGQLILLGARPAMGKSSFASNIAVSFAKKELPVVFFTMEMTETEVLQRMILHTAMVSRKEILQGDKEAAEQAVEAAESICKMPIYIDERSGLSVQQIKAQCYGVKKREGQIGLIVIDYIGLMAIGGGKNSNRAQDIGDVSRALKSFAKEMKCPILLLVQLNRGIEQRSDKKPVMSDLRESGCLEQDADIILFLNGERDFTAESDLRSEQLIVAKNRNGRTGEVPMLFRGDQFLFMEVAEM